MTHVSRVVYSFRAFIRALKAPGPAVLSSEQSIPKIGVALGGGFARGLAHIGVMRVLREEGIPIDFVAGTSVGSIIGALYCGGLSPREMQEIASIVRFRDFARWTVSKLGFCTNDRIDIFLRKTLPCRTFEELETPLAVVATDLVTGDPVVFRSGPLLEAVRASCAYPGFFTPVRVNGRLLVDGMLAHAVPSLPLREMGAERVLAVHLIARWAELRTPKNIFDVVGQCFSIAQVKMSSAWRQHADIVLEPNVDGFTYDGFDRAGELIRAGENAAMEALPILRNWAPITQSATQEGLTQNTELRTPPEQLTA